jgi:DNA gyrase subunit A
MSSSELLPQKIPVAIEDEMKTSFMDYAMSVIIARALPDVRDGLKPVHRRILYTQHQLNNTFNRPFLKSARVVGDCMGKFHPHGDAAIYDALVRLAQDFSMRYPLADGQGNWGSVDGDPAAAMRYTEVRMTRLTSELLADIDKETVDWTPNYDDKELEPTVLPARVPNLLINGAAGIAVGMATNIPPHNLGEIVSACIATIKNPDITVDELLEIVPGPDFPTAGFIHGRQGIRNAYLSGRGQLLMRARVAVEENAKTGRTALIATEIPYQVNKAKLIEKIAELVKEKRLEGISDLRDESDRDGMRVVIELKKDAVPAVVLNNLWKLTPLQESFGIIMLAIVDGRPVVLPLHDMIARFIDHRRDVVTRRTIYDLRQARDREHILEGLKIALDNLDAIIDLIRAARDREQARTELCAGFSLTERQANAILDMRLAQLTGLERDKLLAELEEVRRLIAELESILADNEKLMGVIVKELEGIREQYGDARRTEIIPAELGDISVEQMIAEEEMVVTVTHQGYIKRNPLSAYRSQRRGGRGVTGAQTADENDFVSQLFVASTHDSILMLTSKGRAYAKKVYEIPQAGRAARGKAIVNFLELQAGETVVEFLPVREFSAGSYVVMATGKGVIKKTELSQFGNIRATGIIAILIDEDDQLVDVRITEGKHHILLGTAQGYAIRFEEPQVRPMGRAARGVRGISLREGDQVVGMAILHPEATETLLTVCERGYGKRTPTSDYPVKHRGGKGVITIKTTERNGKVVGVRVVTDQDHLMVITNGGKIIRMPVGGIPTIGRNTQGVRLIRLDDGEQVSTVERLAEHEEEGERKEVELDPAVLAAQAEREAQPLEAELGPEDAEAEGEAEAETPEPGGEDPEGGETTE